MMIPDQQPQGIAGFTLIELLVVITLMAVLAGLVAPNLSGWNCKRELRSDFDRVNGLLQRLRSEALNQSRTMMVRSSSQKLQPLHSTTLGKSSTCGAGAGWRTGNEISELILDRGGITTSSKEACFHPDGTATHAIYTVSAQCSGSNIQYKSEIFSATGFLELTKYNQTSSIWEEL